MSPVPRGCARARARARARGPGVTMQDRVDVVNLAQLCAWLEENHRQTQSVWLVTHKKHTAHYLSYDDVIDALLCWGWVDSRTLRIDADRSGLLIAPRNPKSAWSAINKAKVARLRDAGRMTPAGEALIAIAQDNGMWHFLDDVERLERPGDLTEALGALLTVWEDWPRSVKRGTLEWIKTAKRPETRAKRIDDVVRSAAEGLRPSPFRR